MDMFHNASSYVHDWLSRQSCVKEESLTDWLLYDISNKQPRIYYKAFSRHEESQNGCDWEWWVLTRDEANRYNAYRFLVQAKKLLSNPVDNYPVLNYGNKNGLQIELLLDAAELRSAFPLYMFYSITEPDIEAQVRNIRIISESTLRWCDSCENGCYLSSAYEVRQILHGVPRHKILDIELLDYSCKLSLLDLFFRYSPIECEDLLTTFNIAHITKFNLKKKREGVYGIKHYGHGIPGYLSLFVERHGENLEWFEKEMHRDIGKIGGLGVIDLRNTIDRDSAVPTQVEGE